MDVKLSTIEREVLVAPKSPLHESPFNSNEKAESE